MQPTAPVQVSQSSFLTLADFDGDLNYRKGAGEPGVYLWGFSLEPADYTSPSAVDKFFPYYVGKVDKAGGCMYTRTLEHIAGLAGGAYPVFDVQKAVTQIATAPIGKVCSDFRTANRKTKGQSIISLPDPGFPNLLYFPDGVHRYKQFSTDAGMQEQVQWMLKHFCILYFTPQMYNQQVIATLEKLVGNLVDYDRLITRSYSMPSMEVQIVDSNKEVLLKSYDDLFINRRGQMAGVKFGF